MTKFLLLIFILVTLNSTYAQSYLSKMKSGPPFNKGPCTYECKGCGYYCEGQICYWSLTQESFDKVAGKC
ncbi:unnamed protein product [Callosobruchus maculatus]|uniref:LCN-type CS-alpha/beta domain-containing protein n=1 Tax=Callosobruchus maculatus TaxID=64391 RepID=A0A653CPN8_CALMS|nr:unnamed protein product [Callosobruchus maculatus]